MIRRVAILTLALANALYAAAAEFLTQDEIEAKLIEIKSSYIEGCEFWDNGLFSSFGKVDTPFEYICKICGHRTTYKRDCDNIDLELLLEKLHKAVAEFREKRLDISVDERVLCEECRVGMALPDCGEIVRLPRPPPYSTEYSSTGIVIITNFPLRVGDKVRIVNEDRFSYDVYRLDWEYWVPEKSISEDCSEKARWGVPVRLGPGSDCWKVKTISSHWTGGGVVSNSAVNGWVRLWFASGSGRFSVPVRKCCVGKIGMAGKDTCRRELYRYLKWNINGKKSFVRSGDIQIIRRFLDGATKRLLIHCERLRTLFIRGDSEYGSDSTVEDKEIEVEVNL